MTTSTTEPEVWVPLLGVEEALTKFLETKVVQKYVPFREREQVWMVLWKLLNEARREERVRT